jgi:hypothetical protein
MVFITSIYGRISGCLYNFNIFKLSNPTSTSDTSIIVEVFSMAFGRLLREFLLTPVEGRRDRWEG